MWHCCKQQRAPSLRFKKSKTENSKGAVVHAVILLLLRGCTRSTQVKGTGKHISFEKMRLYNSPCHKKLLSTYMDYVSIKIATHRCIV